MFYLCITERDALPKMDRVALLSEPSTEAIQEADAVTWQEARECIDERSLVHVAGYGWFISNQRYENIRGPLGERMR